jgi:preprotein translocase subunit Sec63
MISSICQRLLDRAAIKKMDGWQYARNRQPLIIIDDISIGHVGMLSGPIIDKTRLQHLDSIELLRNMNIVMPANEVKMTDLIEMVKKLPNKEDVREIPVKDAEPTEDEEDDIEFDEEEDDEDGIDTDEEESDDPVA